MKNSSVFFLSGMNGSRRGARLSVISRILLALNSFHKAEQSTKLIM
jgi:hypothetical protein